MSDDKQSNQELVAKIKVFAKKYKKPLVIAGAIYLALMIGVVAWVFSRPSGTDTDSKQSTYTPPADKYERVAVEGLVVNDACTKLKEKGWAISSVTAHNKAYSETKQSNCDAMDGKVTTVYFNGDTASLYYQIDEPSQKTADNAQPKQETPTRTSYKVSESKAENFCKDKVIYSDKVDIKNLTVSDYSSSTYKETYQETGSYDKNGNYEMQYSWQGKNKVTGKSVSSSCFISGSSDDAIELHWLSMSGVDLYGSAEYQSFDKDGKQL